MEEGQNRWRKPTNRRNYQRLRNTKRQTGDNRGTLQKCEKEETERKNQRQNPKREKEEEKGKAGNKEEVRGEMGHDEMASKLH